MKRLQSSLDESEVRIEALRGVTLDGYNMVIHELQNVSGRSGRPSSISNPFHLACHMVQCRIRAASILKVIGSSRAVSSIHC